jgi:hypothetical protein
MEWDGVEWYIWNEIPLFEFFKNEWNEVVYDGIHSIMFSHFSSPSIWGVWDELETLHKISKQWNEIFIPFFFIKLSVYIKVKFFFISIYFIMLCSVMHHQSKHSLKFKKFKPFFFYENWNFAIHYLSTLNSFFFFRKSH